MRPRIGISLGDAHGIGPEVLLRSLCNKALCTQLEAILYAPLAVIQYYQNKLKLSTLSYQVVSALGPKASTHSGFTLVAVDSPSFSIRPGVPTELATRCAVNSLSAVLKDMPLLDAVLTAPVAKHLVQRYIPTFQGHTEYIAKAFDGNVQPLMLMLCPKLRLALSTTHIPLKEVPLALTKKHLATSLSLLANSLALDFGIRVPQIAVLGLNPHAGENGTIGNEEATRLCPLLEELNSKNTAQYAGPFSADAFFARHRYAKYDAVLALYHDQGLIPFKLLAEDRGVNYTAGLPIPRTSPAHGTAFDIAGKGIANPTATQSALYELLTILKNRQQIHK